MSNHMHSDPRVRPLRIVQSITYEHKLLVLSMWITQDLKAIWSSRGPLENVEPTHMSHTVTLAPDKSSAKMTVQCGLFLSDCPL